VRTVKPDGPGVVLVCSDGLWNYLWEADELAAFVLPLSSPFQVATELTALALDRGGHDNVTVVVVPFPISSPSSTRSSDE
jgi:serine/threonine protein phosphatase PrpC